MRPNFSTTASAISVVLSEHVTSVLVARPLAPLEQERTNLPRLGFGDAPHHRTGQVVRLSARVPRRNNNVVEVNQDPVTLLFAFNTQGLEASLFRSENEVFSHRLHVPGRATGRDNHRVRERTLSTDINNIDIFGFEILQ